jgi:hypothetical protein
VAVAKFAATSAQSKFERVRDEYEVLDEERRASFVDRLLRESLNETHAQLETELAKKPLNI